ncbi:MAG: PEP-CTERM sorting domain-containing protein [Candidatus Omnitrophica bacterium]|nr:PEP-CTERM sorting domain-containing protein [Candidatus Omnitrophota bacterium]MBU1997717.1 PEP-CTERM sorting domain-containing protein [Candidatus Omnitrophota bacterium]MBU4333089.1 PEP-CTERM sorting domain-containing protein [Candidatus Omnitrophota bacterium]
MKFKVISFLFVMIILLSSSASHATIIGHWGFEEGSGTIAVDSINGLNGTISNASYTSGIIGNYALAFNGSNSFVEVAYNALLNPDTVAISLWFNPLGSQLTHADLLDKGHGWETDPYFGGYVLQYDGDTSSIGAHYGNGSIFPSVNSGEGYKDNQWHHIVANLGSDGLDIFMDGVLIESAASAGPIVDNDSPLYFGMHRTLGRYFNGSIDEINIYDTALTQDEVNRLYGSSPVPEPASMLLFGTGLVGAVLRRRRK